MNIEEVIPEVEEALEEGFTPESSPVEQKKPTEPAVSQSQQLLNEQPAAATDVNVSEHGHHQEEQEQPGTPSPPLLDKNHGMATSETSSSSPPFNKRQTPSPQQQEPASDVQQEQTKNKPSPPPESTSPWYKRIKLKASPHSGKKKHSPEARPPQQRLPSIELTPPKDGKCIF